MTRNCCDRMREYWTNCCILDDKAPQFGFEGLPTGSIQENINIHPQIVVIDAYNFQLSLDCIVDNPVDAVLTVIEARTPSHSRLVQEFVFPV